MGLHQQSHQSMMPRDLILMPCAMRYDLLSGRQMPSLGRSADDAPRALLAFSMTATLGRCDSATCGKDSQGAAGGGVAPSKQPLLLSIEGDPEPNLLSG